MNHERPRRTRESAPIAARDAVSVAPRQLLAAFAAADLDAFVHATHAVLRAAVDCEYATAFYVSGPNGLFKEHDSRGRPYSAEFMRRFVDLSPAIPIALANPGITVITTRSALVRPEKALRKTAFYREVMQVQGWRHAVALCFWDDPPAGLPVFVASVNRTRQQGDFSPREVAVLRGLHPLIDAAVRLFCARDAARAAHDGMAAAMSRGTCGHAILDGTLALVEATPIARRLCAAWNDEPSHAGDDPRLWRVPPMLAAACRELHQEWRSLLRGNPDLTGVRLHRHLLHPRIPELTASVTILCPPRHGLADPPFMLEFDRRVHGLALDGADESTAVLRAMTPSERSVAIALADGLSNQEIADRLGKTVSAVKFLLHRTYQKTGVPNRAALVAVLRQDRSAVID